MPTDPYKMAIFPLGIPYSLQSLKIPTVGIFPYEWQHCLRLPSERAPGWTSGFTWTFNQLLLSKSIETLLFRNNTAVLLYLSGLVMAQCCQLVYIHTKFENFGIFSKCLVYKFLIWYIWKIWYIFGIFLAEGLVETWNQCIFYLTKRKQRKHSVAKLYQKVWLFCVTWK